MKSTRNETYHEGRTETLLIYDVRLLGVADRLHSERAAWAEHGDIEAFDRNHYVLIIRPGGARGE